MSLLFLVPLLMTSADVPLHRDSVVHLATVEEASKHLSTRDEFVKALSPFDRQSRLETDRDVTEEEFLRFIASHALAWTDDQAAHVEAAVTTLRDKLAPYRIPFPKTVVFVITSGREEGNAAYCRRNAVILPKGNIDDPPAQLERLINHELFHILSSHNPKLRESLYQIVGFQPCSPITLPPGLRDRKLTNPDAVRMDTYITLKSDQETIRAVPILYSRIARFDPKQGGPFFRYMTFKLMAVEESGGQWQPVEQNGEARLIDPSAAPDFARQIGKNTDYIIHPDEILAENFVHLVQQKQNLPNPEIVEQMKKLLTAGAESTKGE